MAPAEDGDGDSVPAILEYAFNLDPASPDGGAMAPGGSAGLPAVTVEGQATNAYLTIEFLRRRNAVDLDYSPQFSQDLTNWVAPGAVLSVSPVNGDWERVIVRDAVPVPAAPRRFGRVGVTVE